MTPMTTILLLALSVFIRGLYEVTQYKYGSRIKAYFDHQKDIYYSNKHYDEIQDANRIRIYKDSLPEEVDVEDMGLRGYVSEVHYTTNRDGLRKHHIIDITPSESLAVQEF